jgi:SAM-dependent methyltransferase
MSFGSIAEDYDGLRPHPPHEAVDWLLPSECEVAVDVGAGTGLFTRALAGRAAQVVAVEPDARMRAVLAERSPEVRAVAGTGEAIPLPDHSADAVFVSSAWHWMDSERAVPEIGRVLRDGGRFGLIWTSRDRGVDWVRTRPLPPPPRERRAPRSADLSQRRPRDVRIRADYDDRRRRRDARHVQPGDHRLPG